jgi:hypothetical protein
LGQVAGYSIIAGFGFGGVSFYPQEMYFDQLVDWETEKGNTNHHDYCSK